MKKYQLLLLALASGVLLSAGLFPNGIFPFLFIGFVPLLMLEDQLIKNPQYDRRGFLFFSSYLAFFVWNILTTWWVKNASFGGAVLAILCNALLMAITFCWFHRVKKRMGERWGPLLFICFWIAFEFIHHHWDISWPWLTLGNAFADAPSLVQWYEYTGTFGGSLWVLLMNIFIFYFILTYKTASRKSNVRNVCIILTTLLVPMLVSLLLGPWLNYSKGGISVVVVQPNIDPYNEKFVSSDEEQVAKMLALAEKKVTQYTDYLIFPETALADNIWEDQLDHSASIALLNAFLKKYPKLKIITGASTGKIYKYGEPLSVTARKFTQEDGYYDAYNTALQLDHSGIIQTYHKSKLVPGVEALPFPFIFKHFEGLAIDLGGTTGGLGKQEERTVFASPDSNMRVAPVICYESIYGEYVSEYVKNGANFIAIITNDGWWGDTPGYRQHLKFGALRAIETRRWIARSANTGISCFIDPYGHIQQPTKWWTPDVISQRIALSSEETFYTKYGDYIARAALCMALAAIIYSMAIRFRIAKKS